MFKTRVFISLMFVLFSTFLVAQPKRQDPDAVKSTLVFLFGEQIDWGGLPTKKFRIVCIGLSNSRVKALSKLSEVKKISERKVVVSSVNKIFDLPEAEIIVIGEDRLSEYNLIYKRVLGEKTVLVSENLTFKSKMMINIYRKKNNTYAFEIDKMNLLKQGVDPKVELIIFGDGSKGDVLTKFNKVDAELKMAKDSLVWERKVLEKSRVEISDLRKEIRVEKKKLQEQKIISEGQDELIILQENKILKKEKAIEKFSRHLDEVKEDIEAREFQLKIKNSELKKYESEVLHKQTKLKDVNTEVLDQLQKISEQKDQIKKQEEIIKAEADVIERQRFLLALQIGFIVLVAVVLVLLFLTYRRNKKNNFQLANQNKAIQRQTVELNARNQELIVSREGIKKAFKELNDAQSQLVQAEKLASLGMLIAGVAHDINTPLGAINASAQNMSVVVGKLFTGFTNLVRQFSERELIVFKGLVNQWEVQSVSTSSLEKRKKKRVLKEELENEGIPNASTIASYLIDIGVFNVLPAYMILLKREDNLLIFENIKVVIDLKAISETVKQAVDKASDVVQALKKYSREDEEVMEEVDVKDSVETVISIYRRNLTDINLELSFAEYKGDIFGKYSALCQVWTNLIHNAVQSMDKVGNLKIGIKVVKGKLCVYVQDEGGGIRDEDKEKIFNPFFTTKKRGEGTGLGLDICKKIVEKHGGEISFESELGIGTTFNVYLPIKKY